MISFQSVNLRGGKLSGHLLKDRPDCHEAEAVGPGASRCGHTLCGVEGNLELSVHF
jgi:hypothetical protein